VNIYALEDGDGWTIVDTGMYSQKGVEIWENLMAGPLQGRPIKRAIVTHHHPDHIGAMGWLKSEHKVEIWMTRTAWLMGRMLTLSVEERLTPENERFLRRAGMPPKKLAKRLSERPYNFCDVVHPIPLGFTRIRQGDEIEIGTRRFTVHEGHGHAPHHATLWADDVVLSGDQIIPGISSNLGVYATEPDADPVGEWFESCERLLNLATNTQLALPGHKLPFTGIPTRLNQLIGNHHSALERLSEHLAAPRTAAECFSPLFGRQIEDGAYGLALVESVGHLNHMLSLGQATRNLRGDGAYVWQRVQN